MIIRIFANFASLAIFISLINFTNYCFLTRLIYGQTSLQLPAYNVKFVKIVLLFLPPPFCPPVTINLIEGSPKGAFEIAA